MNMRLGTTELSNSAKQVLNLLKPNENGITFSHDVTLAYIGSGLRLEKDTDNRIDCTCLYCGLDQECTCSESIERFISDHSRCNEGKAHFYKPSIQPVRIASCH